MKQSFAFLLLLICLRAEAQQYYKDLLTVQSSRQKQQLLQKNKVKKILFNSFDGEHQPIEGFQSTQTINRDFTELSTRTTTTLSGNTLSMFWFNRQMQVIQSLDSSDDASTSISYEYDTKGNLISLKSTTTSAGDFRITEDHIWTYSPANKPERMLKIKNGKDTTFYSFVLDEKGNVVEENGMTKGKNIPAVFYYYDEQNNLTDIVRYNIAAKRLLPDYVFEYENGRLATMMVVPEEGTDYQKWYYSYDEDGLKILDACYSKSKVLIGTIEYAYEYY